MKNIALFSPLILLRKILYIYIYIYIIYIYILYIYIYTYIIIYIKNFAWEDQRRKRCYIIHIALQGVNSAIFFVYRTEYTYGKEPEGFQKVFLSPLNAK